MAHRVRFIVGGATGSKDAYNAKEWRNLGSNGMDVHVQLQIAQHWGSEVGVEVSLSQVRRRGMPRDPEHLEMQRPKGNGQSGSKRVN